MLQQRTYRKCMIITSFFFPKQDHSLILWLQCHKCLEATGSHYLCQSYQSASSPCFESTLSPALGWTRYFAIFHGNKSWSWNVLSVQLGAAGVTSPLSSSRLTMEYLPHFSSRGTVCIFSDTEISLYCQFIRGVTISDRESAQVLFEGNLAPKIFCLHFCRIGRKYSLFSVSSRQKQ